MANETIVGSRSRSGGLSLERSSGVEVDEICKLVLLGVKGHIRELLGELFDKLEGYIEAGFEVGIHHDRSRPASLDFG